MYDMRKMVIDVFFIFEGIKVRCYDEELGSMQVIFV